MSASEDKDSETKGDEDPKIIVDTDWKEQIAREKEAAEKSERAAEQSDDVAEQSDDVAEPSDDVAEAGTRQTPAAGGGDDESPPMPPPASFDVLVTMLFTQAMAMLGQMPDPASGKTTVNKPFAKHYIDTLDMLGEKTSGNLSDEEATMLSEALHALRMMYVNVRD